MYRRLRLRLTLWYVFFSTFTFLVLGLVGTGVCYESVTLSLNESIESLTAHALAIVDESQPGIVRFKVPSDSLKTEWSRMKATIQLYDLNRKLVAEYGPSGYDRLCQADYLEQVINNRNLRMTSDPLSKNGVPVGYLQVEVSTESREQAVRTFAITMGFLAPLLILTLAVSGYIFSGRTRPIEEAFMMLRQFLADAGHELRTPIHLIQLTAENALVSHEADCELAEDLQAVVRATERMGKLTDDMMMLAKLEVKQLNVKMLPVRIDRLLSDCLAENVLAARERGIELEGGIFPSATVIGDGDALYRVVANLIENALRYTDSGGKVFVDLQLIGRLVRLSIRDTGIGIPAENLPLIFDRFYRVDASRSRAAGGSGLGLSIVKGICQVHKGRVEVSSQAGKGSTFTVFLPLAPPLAPPPAPDKSS